MYNTIEQLEEACSVLDLDIDTLVWERTPEQQVTLEGYRIHIPQLNIDIYPALAFTFDDDEGDYLLDYDLFLFFPSGSNDYVYSEGYSTLYSAINNFLHTLDKDVTVNDLTYEILMDMTVTAPTL